jgi:hypothetical protein
MIRLIYNIFVGQVRSRKLAKRYSFNPQFIVDYYFLVFKEKQSIEPQNTLDIKTFEKYFRENLALEGIDIRCIEPVYCKENDVTDISIETNCSKYQRMAMCRFPDLDYGSDETNDTELMMNKYLRNRGIDDLPKLD